MLKKTALLAKLAYRNVLRNSRRSFLTVCAIAVGIISSNMLAALSRGMEERLISDTIENLPGHIQIHAPLYLDDPMVEHSMEPADSALVQAMSTEQVLAWSSRVRVPGVIRSERESAGVTIVGIDPAQEKQVSFIGNALTDGRFLESTDDNGVIVGEKLLDFLQTKLNRRVVLISQNMSKDVGERGYRVVGTYKAELESTEKAYVFAGKKTLQKMLGLGDKVSEVAVLAKDRGNLDALAALFSRAAGAREVKTWIELEPLVVSMVEMQNKFLYFWYIIVMVAVGFGLANTLFMAIFERTREIGLFQALGMDQWMILGQVVLESIVLLIVGAIAGNFLTGGLLFYFSGGIDLSKFAQGTELFGMGSMIYPVLRLDDAIEVNVIVLIIGVLASLYPAWRATRLVPVDAITRV